MVSFLLLTFLTLKLSVRAPEVAQLQRLFNHIGSKDNTYDNDLKVTGVRDSRALDRPKVLPVYCPFTQRRINGFWDWSVTVDDGNISKEYFVLHPINDVVAICRIDEGAELEPVEPDSRDMDRIFPVAYALFREDGLLLERTPMVLTVHGELIKDADCDIDTDLGDSNAPIETVTSTVVDDDDDVVELLAEFEVGYESFVLVRLLEPVYFIAGDKSSACISRVYEDLELKEYELLSPEESDILTPLIEDAILHQGMDSFGGR